MHGALSLLLLAASAAAQGQWPFSMWRNNAFKEKETAPEGLPSGYHTTQGISDTLTALAKKCPGLTIEARAHEPCLFPWCPKKNENIKIDVVKYKAPNMNAEHRAMVFAGEHARELIGAETALAFVETLCDPSHFPTSLVSEPAANRLKSLVTAATRDTEFLIVVNANPESRKKVEAGDFCLRVNPEGTDINRNWDINWNSIHDTKNADTNPGKSANSAAETQILQKIMDQFKPHTYLDLHSGNLGLYLPNKLATDFAMTNRVKSFIANVDEHVCKCPLGIANEEVGYKTCGSALDYSFEKVGTTFALAMEIWVPLEGKGKLNEKWAAQKKKLEGGASSFLELGSDGPGEQIVMLSKEKLDQKVDTMSGMECLNFFNPPAEKHLQVTYQWTTTLLELTMKGRTIAKKGVPDLPKNGKMKVDAQEEPLWAPARKSIDRGVYGLVGFLTSNIMKLGGFLLLSVALYFAWKVIGQKLFASRPKEEAPLSQAMGSIQVRD